MSPRDPQDQRPDLAIDYGDLTVAVRELCDLFAKAGCFFERDVPVKITRPADGSLPLATPLTANTVVLEAHQICRPVKWDQQEETYVPTTLPDRVARLYLDMRGEWNLNLLDGTATTPLLAQDGAVRTAKGYDPITRLWCTGIPEVQVLANPTRDDAEAALMRLRKTFRTFPFADSPRLFDPDLGFEIVDVNKDPHNDESAFLVALITAVARPSLPLAPGFILNAPALSGAGSGKGLLVRAISTIAFGVKPRAFTAGSDKQELDKRLVAELIEAHPVLFLDNVNGAVLRSDTLASVITENPARVRVLGVSRMVLLNSAAFIAITGNALSVSEDLARRFILVQLDAKCEDPENRPFPPGFLVGIGQRRLDLLANCLTVAVGSTECQCPRARQAVGQL